MPRSFWSTPLSDAIFGRDRNRSRGHKRPSLRVRLGVEGFESRVVPATIAISPMSADGYYQFAANSLPDDVSISSPGIGQIRLTLDDPSDTDTFVMPTKLPTGFMMLNSTTIYSTTSSTNGVATISGYGTGSLTLNAAYASGLDDFSVTTSDNISVSPSTVIMLNAGTTASQTQGSITLSGVGDSVNHGGITINGATLNAAGGSININGKGMNSLVTNLGSNYYGVEVEGKSLFETSGAGGLITIQGNGGNAGGNDDYGVLLTSTTAGSPTLEANDDGTVKIMGTGAGSGSTDDGVFLDGATVSAGALVSITGIGANASTSDDGIAMSGGLVTSPLVSLSGTAGLKSSVGVDLGGTLSGAGVLVSAMADVTGSSSGSIADDASVGQGLISGTTTVLTAFSGIGTTGPLKTQVNNLDASTLSGGVWVSNAGSLTIGNSFNATTGIKDSGGPADVINITTAGNLTVGQPVQGPGNITLDAAGGGLLTINANVQNNLSTPGPTPLVTFLGTGGVVFNSSSTTSAPGVQELNIQVNNGNRSVASGSGVTLNGATLNANGGTVTILGYGSGSGTGANGVNLNAGSKVLTSGKGAISIDGYSADSPGSYNFGVVLAGATVNSDSTLSGTNSVTIVGVASGTNASGEDSGILMNNNSFVTGFVVTMYGKGAGSSGNGNDGLYITDSNTKIQGYGGGVSLTGYGGGSGAGEYGVDIENGASVNSPSSVLVKGVAAGDGVGVTLGLATLNANGGNVTVEGYGAGSGNSENGVDLNTGSKVMTSGNGAINIDGYAANSPGSYNDGVVLTGASVTSNMPTSSGSNSVTIVGVAGGVGTSGGDSGILIVPGSSVSGFAVTMTGTGGNGSGSNNDGLFITGPNNSPNAEIQGGGGGVSLTGYGAGSGTHEDGMDIVNGASVASTSTLTILGVAAGTGSDTGVYIGSVPGEIAKVTCSGGTSTTFDNLSICGTNNGTNSANWGVAIVGGSEVTETGEGGFDLVGSGGRQGPANANNAGVLITGQATQVTTAIGFLEIDGTDFIPKDAKGIVKDAASTVKNLGGGGSYQNATNY